MLPRARVGHGLVRHLFRGSRRCGSGVKVHMLPLPRRSTSIARITHRTPDPCSYATDHPMRWCHSGAAATTGGAAASSTDITADHVIRLLRSDAEDDVTLGLRLLATNVRDATTLRSIAGGGGVSLVAECAANGSADAPQWLHAVFALGLLSHMQPESVSHATLDPGLGALLLRHGLLVAEEPTRASVALASLSSLCRACPATAARIRRQLKPSRDITPLLQAPAARGCVVAMADLLVTLLVAGRAPDHTDAAPPPQSWREAIVLLWSQHPDPATARLLVQSRSLFADAQQDAAVRSGVLQGVKAALSADAPQLVGAALGVLLHVPALSLVSELWSSHLRRIFVDHVAHHATAVALLADSLCVHREGADAHLLQHPDVVSSVTQAAAAVGSGAGLRALVTALPLVPDLHPRVRRKHVDLLSDLLHRLVATPLDVTADKPGAAHAGSPIEVVYLCVSVLRLHMTCVRPPDEHGWEDMRAHPEAPTIASVLRCCCVVSAWLQPALAQRATAPLVSPLFQAFHQLVRNVFVTMLPEPVTWADRARLWSSFLRAHSEPSSRDAGAVDVPPTDALLSLARYVSAAVINVGPSADDTASDATPPAFAQHRHGLLAALHALCTQGAIADVMLDQECVDVLLKAKEEDVDCTGVRSAVLVTLLLHASPSRVAQRLFASQRTVNALLCGASVPDVHMLTAVIHVVGTLLAGQEGIRDINGSPVYTSFLRSDWPSCILRLVVFEEERHSVNADMNLVLLAGTILFETMERSPTTVVPEDVLWCGRLIQALRRTLAATKLPETDSATLHHHFVSVKLLYAMFRSNPRMVPSMMDEHLLALCIGSLRQCDTVAESEPSALVAPNAASVVDLLALFAEQQDVHVQALLEVAEVVDIVVRTWTSFAHSPHVTQAALQYCTRMAQQGGDAEAKLIRLGFVDRLRKGFESKDVNVWSCVADATSQVCDVNRMPSLALRLWHDGILEAAIDCLLRCEDPREAPSPSDANPVRHAVADPFLSSACKHLLSLLPLLRGASVSLAHGVDAPTMDASGASHPSLKREVAHVPWVRRTLARMADHVVERGVAPCLRGSGSALVLHLLGMLADMDAGVARAVAQRTDLMQLLRHIVQHVVCNRANFDAEARLWHEATKLDAILPVGMTCSMILGAVNESPDVVVRCKAGYGGDADNVLQHVMTYVERLGLHCIDGAEGALEQRQYAELAGLKPLSLKRDSVAAPLWAELCTQCIILVRHEELVPQLLRHGIVRLCVHALHRGNTRNAGLVGLLGLLDVGGAPAVRAVRQAVHEMGPQWDQMMLDSSGSMQIQFSAIKGQVTRAQEGAQNSIESSSS